jgi:hypothetical protein
MLDVVTVSGRVCSHLSYDHAELNILAGLARSLAYLNQRERSMTIRNLALARQRSHARVPVPCPYAPGNRSKQLEPWRLNVTTRLTWLRVVGSLVENYDPYQYAPLDI